MDNLISVAFACDENYAKHVAVVIKSIFANALESDKHEFHILTMGLSLETTERLQQVVDVGDAILQIHHINPQPLTKLPENRHTLNAYLRLFLPEIIVSKDKVLYLDADLLVFDSLRKLWHFPLENFLVAATVDSSVYLGGIAIEHFKALELPPEHHYFNSGVLLLNLKKLRETNLFDKVVAWAQQKSHLMKHSDQDALNALLLGNVAYFHPRWNLQVPMIYPVWFGWGYTQEQVEAVANPAIIHYVTKRKPWNLEYKLPYKRFYFHYLAQTPWRNDPTSRLTVRKQLNRVGEELEWFYNWGRFQIKRVMGRHPQLKPSFKHLSK